MVYCTLSPLWENNKGKAARCRLLLDYNIKITSQSKKRRFMHMRFNAELAYSHPIAGVIGFDIEI